MSAVRNTMTLMITTEALISGAFVVDESHRIISWNDVATRTLGFGSDMTLGRTCEETLALLQTQDVSVCPDISATLASNGSANARCPAEALLLNPQPLRRQDDVPARIRVITQRGEPRWLEVHIVPARKLDGSACIVHLFRDVTEDAERPGQGSVAAHIFHHPGTVLRFPAGDPESTGCDDPPMATLEHLTPREHEVLELLARGMATVEIATALGISRVTARNHVTRVIEKLGVKTRLQAVLAASRLGLI